jgi:ubiquinone/menaquinone biosynthesis C-methylase UbiE
MKITTFFDNLFYSRFSSNWDDELFREIILSNINNRSIVLDIGAGAGIVGAMNFKNIAKSICGIDLDPRVKNNKNLDEGKVADASEIPYLDNKFDVVFANNFMEHLEHPEVIFNEINRVLKPDGILLFKTPNRKHYMPIIARCTPFIFHKFVNKLRGRNTEDTFSTYYLANSTKQIKILAKNSNFVVKKMDFIEGRPEYLRFNAITYILGLIYERVVNSGSFFSQYRIVIITVLRKPN